MLNFFQRVLKHSCNISIFIKLAQVIWKMIVITKYSSLLVWQRVMIATPVIPQGLAPICNAGQGPLWLGFLNQLWADPD